MNRWRAYADKLADKLMDAGNLIFGALIVGQLISTREFNYWIAALGIAAWAGFYLWAWAVVVQSDRSDR